MICLQLGHRRLLLTDYLTANAELAVQITFRAIVPVVQAFYYTALLALLVGYLPDLLAVLLSYSTDVLAA
jgi:hypothetical protein